MTSIFDLKTSVSELSSTNDGTSKMQYDQHPPTRDVTTNNFPNGAIHFRFETSGQKWWIPSRSYMRIRCQLAQQDGTQLLTASNIAPNMALASTLFQSAEMRINDKVVSRISDFMPQVDALETRLTKSKSWLDSIGVSTNWWEEDQKIRQAEVASDGAILKNQAPTIATETTTIDTAMGFAANNSVEYNQTTGVVTFAAGGGAGPPNTDTVFQVGDFLVLTALPNNEVGALNVRLEVIDVPAGALTMTVRADIGVAIGADNGNRFSRIRVNPPVASPDSRRVGEFELTWTPPLSLFKVGHALPSGRYELVLNPQTATSYQRYAIESVVDNKVPNTGTIGTPSAGSNFIFNVVDMYLYCATVDGPRADDITYLLDLEQTRCQSEKIDSVNFQQKNFDVSPSTYALTVAYQDQRAGNDTRASASRFVSYNGALDTSTEKKLNRFFINYAGQNLPAPDADLAFVLAKDYTTQRYTESQIYSGAYHDTGGAETLEEWHGRGSYYYFAWPRKPSHCVCCY